MFFLDTNSFAKNFFFNSDFVNFFFYNRKISTMFTAIQNVSKNNAFGGGGGGAFTLNSASQIFELKIWSSSCIRRTLAKSEAASISNYKLFHASVSSSQALHRYIGSEILRLY